MNSQLWRSYTSEISVWSEDINLISTKRRESFFACLPSKIRGTCGLLHYNQKRNSQRSIHFLTCPLIKPRACRYVHAINWWAAIKLSLNCKDRQARRAFPWKNWFPKATSRNTSLPFCLMMSVGATTGQWIAVASLKSQENLWSLVVKRKRDKVCARKGKILR